jgi:prepilin-type N-terminal cleavage/methylation domain-containing protein
MKVQTQRGFTLLEMAVAMAIFTVLAGISFAALGGMKKRASYSNATTELAMAVKRMRAEAMGRGVSTVFVVDTVGKRWWGLVAPDAGFDLATFSPTAPGKVLVSGTLPSDVSFGPTTNLPALSAPFSAVPVTTTATAPAPRYCSFCRATGANTGFGAVLFSSSGTAKFTLDSSSASASAIGHQFSIQGVSGALTRTFTVAIIGRTGVIEVFES